MPFFVEVSDCATQLSDEAVQSPITLTNTWFQSDTNGVSIQMYLDQLQQTPNCGFAYQYNLFYEAPNGSLIQPPSGVNVVDGMIYIEKCLNPAQDAECSQEPFTVVYPMVLVVYLDDGKISTPQQQSVEIPVIGTLIDPCANSDIWLTETESLLPYTIADGTAMYYQPTLNSDLSTCPISCELTYPNGTPVTPVVQGFSIFSLETTIGTADKSMNG